MINNIRTFLTNKWFKFGVVALCYLLWVIWLSNYWWLLGLVIIFDLYITKKVKWAFWKKHYKEGEKHNMWLDWLDAIIFALIAATFIRMYFYEAYMIPSGSMERTLMTGDYLFVSKWYYGPRVPETPLSLPLVHNTAPGTRLPSFLTWVKWDYRRLAGRSEVKRDDIVVFGFPNGDTVLTQLPEADYHALVRREGRRNIIANYGPVTVRPVDKKDNYVKRCVAVAGDTLELREGRVWVNGRQQDNFSGLQYIYHVETNGKHISASELEAAGIERPDVLRFDNTLPGYEMNLTDEKAERLRQFPQVKRVEQMVDYYPSMQYIDTWKDIFPFSPQYTWKRDTFGPLWIPAKGASVALTVDNLPLYRRIIEIYEHNTLRVAGDTVYINDEVATAYTFKMNYYFMMGDNRHHSLDSRYFGFVPEDHIVGTPSLVWMSVDKNKPFPRNIRWNRLFKFL